MRPRAALARCHVAHDRPPLAGCSPCHGRAAAMGTAHYTGAERYGPGQRQVQYYDAGRMEIPDLAMLPTTPGYVRGGAVVRELASGIIDIGQGEVQRGA